MDNHTLIKNLIPLWYAQRIWAEELLKRAFNLSDAADILNKEYRGNKQIPGTNWMYQTHGIGVNIYRTEEVGGIDIDFDKPEPDTWRLKIFFEKQYNEGNLPYKEYRHLFQNEELLDSVIKEVLGD